MPSAEKRLHSVIVKPAGPDCNLNCSYCFYLNKAKLFQPNKKHRMPSAILKEIVRQVMVKGGSHLSFVWQGGEPILMGLPFFRKAVEFQKQYGHNRSVGNGLQTNGLLIDRKWARCFRKNNFLIGLSIDGPEHIHNRYRIKRGGKGSWRRVMDSANLLLDSGVAVNALTVLTDYSADFPEEIYHFHKSVGHLHMQFIPCVEPSSYDPAQIATFSISPEKYGQFLCTLFDLWCADFKNGRPSTSIRYFDSVFYSYVGMTAPECTLLRECGNYLVIEHNGDVYSCDFFVEHQWKLGNVMKKQLHAMLNSDRQNQFGKAKAAITDACRKCRWLLFCRGGCLKDRRNNPQDKEVSYFCRSYKMFFAHADARLRTMAKEWKWEQQNTFLIDSTV